MTTRNISTRFIENPLNCPVTRAMSIIGGKWRPIIINCIGEKKIRFGKLRQIIPAISNKVLSNELKELENYGLIKRLEFSEMPPRVEYELTTQGKTLLPILHSIADWGNSSIVINIMEEFG